MAKEVQFPEDGGIRLVDKPGKDLGAPYIFHFPKALRKKCELICANRPGNRRHTPLSQFVRESIELNVKKNANFVY